MKRCPWHPRILLYHVSFFHNCNSHKPTINPVQALFPAKITIKLEPGCVNLWAKGCTQRVAAARWSWDTGFTSISLYHFTQLSTIITHKIHMYRGRVISWVKGSVCFVSEIPTPSHFFPSPFCGGSFKTEQALKLWPIKYLDPCRLNYFCSM